MSEADLAEQQARVVAMLLKWAELNFFEWWSDFPDFPPSAGVSSQLIAMGALRLYGVQENEGADVCALARQVVRADPSVAWSRAAASRKMAALRKEIVEDAGALEALGVDVAALQRRALDTFRAQSHSDVHEAVDVWRQAIQEGGTPFRVLRLTNESQDGGTTH